MSAGNGSIQVTCPQCSKQLAVPAQHAGKQGRCPACKSVFSIPHIAAANAQFAPAPAPYPHQTGYPQQPNWQTPAPQPGYMPAPPWQAPAMPGEGLSVYGNAPSATPAWNAAPTAPFPQPSPYNQQPSPFGAPPPQPMNGFQPLYQNQNPAMPAQATNPFGEQEEGDLRLAPSDPTPSGHSLAPAYNAYASPALGQPDAYSGAFGTEKKGMDAGILGGIGLMLLAVVWFFGGLAAGIIFFYPPILFIIGIVAVVRGLFNR